MNNEFAPEFKEYLAEYQLQKPPEVVVHYQGIKIQRPFQVLQNILTLIFLFRWRTGSRVVGGSWFSTANRTL